MKKACKVLSILSGALGLPAEAYGLEIPLNIGVGPSLFTLPDRVLTTKIDPFFGINLKIKAIIDKETIEKNKARIPIKYRNAIEKTNEVRIGYLYIPANLIIAPGGASGQPSIYGATWKPLGLDLPVSIGPASLSLGTELVLTYAAITTELENQTQVNSKGKTTTHFVRPGISLNAELDAALSKSILISLGASSSFYIPQTLKGANETGDPLWRMSELRATLNYRFPVEVNL